MPDPSSTSAASNDVMQHEWLQEAPPPMVEQVRDALLGSSPEALALLCHAVLCPIEPFACVNCKAITEVVCRD